MPRRIINHVLALFHPARHNDLLILNAQGKRNLEGSAAMGSDKREKLLRVP